MALGTPVAEALAATNDAGSLTTASFTPQDNSLLIVFYSGQEEDGTVASISDSLTSTWTLQDSGAQGGYQDSGAVWTTEITTGASMTVTVTAGSSFFQTHLRAISVTGYDTTTPVGQAVVELSGGNSGSYSLTLDSTSESNSLVIGFANGRTAVVSEIDTGASWTQLDEDDSGGSTSHVQYRTAAVSSVPWAEYVSDGYGAGAVVAIEVQEGAAAGGSLIVNNSERAFAHMIRR